MGEGVGMRVEEIEGAICAMRVTIRALVKSYCYSPCKPQWALSRLSPRQRIMSGVCKNKQKHTIIQDKQ